MMMQILDSPSRFDPTPQEQHASAVAAWRDLETAYAVERRVVAERIDQLAALLRNLDQHIAAAGGHASVTLQSDRLTVAEKLENCKDRLPAIDSVIAAHRKAKP